MTNEELLALAFTLHMEDRGEEAEALEFLGWLGMADVCLPVNITSDSGLVVRTRPFIVIESFDPPDSRWQQLQYITGETRWLRWEQVGTGRAFWVWPVHLIAARVERERMANRMAWEIEHGV